ncbi:hypothetical protein CPB84DRAFT_1826107 [Gymnopilus junonius]|uniref:DUF6534 domain-containing protein n=1 Tax=Gymnopilus junonius TaxID=109634 RepID=A0A9P5TM74_GYMJU|nr:hypothetical protein CPB84DRAFT_1826107 [Gymnopilus junonius]
MLSHIMDSSFNAHPTLGAFLIGLFFSCCLFGISTAQTYTYSTRCQEDGIWIKLMVIAIWLCELGQYICICQAAYNLAVINFGHPSTLSTISSSIDAVILISAIIITVAQSFFIERLRRISKGHLILTVCWALALTRFAMLVALSSRMMKMKNTDSANVLRETKGLYTTALIAGAAVDFFIAFYLVHHIKFSKPTSRFQSTSDMIDRVAMWAIETGLLTRLTESTLLVFFIAMPENWVWQTLFACISRIFSNTLLATLNGRTQFRERVLRRGSQEQRFLMVRTIRTAL